MRSAPVELSETINVAELLGKQVSFQGVFDHSREVLVGLRAPPAGTFDAAQVKHMTTSATSTTTYCYCLTALRYAMLCYAMLCYVMLCYACLF
jgi:hypothetical protein